MTTVRLPPAQYRKYRNVPTEVEGVRFPSKKEASRFSELRLLEKAGKIIGLSRQVPISIDINGVHICTYVADFVYTEKGQIIWEDAKGVRTREYKLKKKLVWAVKAIAINEV